MAAATAAAAADTIPSTPPPNSTTMSPSLAAPGAAAASAGAGAPAAPATANDVPSVAQLNGIGIKGLKVPETSDDVAGSKGKCFLFERWAPRFASKALRAATSGTTVGRVPDGTVFSVPETHDLIQTLFSPNEPKTLPEWITLGLMGLTLFLFFATNTPRQVFLAMFIFWRCMYNIGLGVLLNAQSKDRKLVRLAKKFGFGPAPQKPRAQWVQFLISQVTRKMSKNGVAYDYESMPIEFNTWILYRGLVDIILVNDFSNYVAFAVAYYESPEGGYGWLDALRYAAGIVMLLFNLWVKTDAHRVVKDFAWYWGDFFFLVDASLTFDGVFEMAPHPMYSVGYIGFYATALIAQSYWVLFVSLAAHAGQMVFLHFVENPHIDKTYNPPTASTGAHNVSNPLYKYFGRDLVVFKNLDWFRATDLQTVVLASYTIIAAFMIGPIDRPWKFWFYVGQTLAWRVIHTYGLGAILYLQSNHRVWNRHFIKHGETTKDAFQSWKVIYNTTQLMSYVSFCVCAVRLFVAPEGLLHDMFLLRATLGVLFIILHMWIAVSIYEVIGSSGWFYGDFFIDELRHGSGPIYSGLYRYLDNPLLYTFSCWGVAMFCGSPTLYAITLFGQVSNWLFLRYVEQPHMRRMYGSQIRQEAGVERVLKSKVGELERGVEKLAKDFDMLEVLNRIKEVTKTGEKELRKVMGPTAWKEFVDRARGRKAARGMSFDTPPESEDDVDATTSAVTTTTENHVLLGRDGLRLRRKPSNESEMSMESQDELGHKGGLKTPRRSATNSLPLAVERIIEELEELVDQARPKFMAVVGETAKKLVGDSRSALVPVDLYNVNFPSCPADRPATFRLGEPIEIEFTAATDTLTARDWIGLYPITANPNPALTTTKSDGRWMFITGSSKDEWDADSEAVGTALIKDTQNGDAKTTTTTANSKCIGRVPVTLSTIEKRGVRHAVATGRLRFPRDRLPWAVGVYEARYHYQGNHDVIAISRAFQIVADEYEWQDGSVALGNEDESVAVARVLRPIVETCVDVDLAAGESELALGDTILDRVKVDNCPDVGAYAKYQETVARRITYAIKQTFGIEFSWKVISLDGTTAQLAKRICSARAALLPREYQS
ncbi:phosphatidylethanolamine N-methyltransferase [Geranomyces michiganensis]|nr:phosphatidylethanolamine N-methyltransferase [Geranomyces michiganensis]